MIDLKEFFIKNATSNYRRYWQVILKCPPYTLNDNKEVITAFKELLKPTWDEMKVYENNNEKFIMISLWLFIQGYSIKQFPNILAYPENLKVFAYDKIRAYLLERNNYTDGAVPWKDRRELIDSLDFIMPKTYPPLKRELLEKMRLISTRGSDFYSMKVDEKLSSLNQLIEMLTKSQGKYLNLDYDKIFFDTANRNSIINYRKQTHCFRHGTMEDINERQQMTSAKKRFLINYGIFLSNCIYEYDDKP